MCVCVCVCVCVRARARASLCRNVVAKEPMHCPQDVGVTLLWLLPLYLISSCI